MIRFSAFLVVVAVGLLVAGVVTSKLMLVYLAIGVSGVALLALGVGAAVKWRELFGKPQAAEAEVGVQELVSVPAPQAQTRQAPVPQTPVPQPQLEHQHYPRPATAPADPGRQPATAEPPVLAKAPAPAAKAPAPAQAPVPAEVAVAAKAPAPAVAQDQATAGAGPDGPGRPGAADQQPPEVKETRPPGQDLQPAADSRPMTDLQVAKATQQPAEDVPNAPAVVQPAAVPVPARTPSPEPAAAPVPASASPEAAANSIPASPPHAVPSPSLVSAQAADSAGPQTPQTPQDSRTGVTVVPGVPRYHNASCILIRFMGEGDLETMTLAAARAAGCTPCRACLPDQPDKQPDLPPPRNTGQVEHRQAAGSAIGRLHRRASPFPVCRSSVGRFGGGSGPDRLIRGLLCTGSAAKPGSTTVTGLALPFSVAGVVPVNTVVLRAIRPVPTGDRPVTHR